MNLFIKDEYGHIMTISPEELKEKLGITFDIVALGIEVNNGGTTIKAQSYPKWNYSNGNPPIDICVAAKSDEMQVASLTLPTPDVPLLSSVSMMSRVRTKRNGMPVPALRLAKKTIQLLMWCSLTGTMAKWFPKRISSKTARKSAHFPALPTSSSLTSKLPQLKNNT